MNILTCLGMYLWIYAHFSENKIWYQVSFLITHHHDYIEARYTFESNTPDLASTNIRLASRIFSSCLHCPGQKSPLISNSLDTGFPVLTIVQQTFYLPSLLPETVNIYLIIICVFYFSFILVSNFQWIWDLSLRVIFPCYTPFKN